MACNCSLREATMKKIAIILIGILISSIAISGCVKIPEGEISLTVNSVEKRHYDDYGEPASSGSVLLYVFFTIKNEVEDELSTSTLFFKLASPTGKTYSPKWFFGSGGSEATAVSKGASASYYIAFEVDEDENVNTSWQLNFDSWQATKSANLTNIKSGFHDVFLAILTIDSYYYSDEGDYVWEIPAEGNTFIYVNITLANSADNDESISTNQFYFTLYITGSVGYNPEGDEEGKPDEILPSGQASWYIYFEIPEDATLDKLQYDAYGIAPVEASFT
jgi:hypothetical protein